MTLYFVNANVNVEGLEMTAAPEQPSTWKKKKLRFGVNGNGG